LKKGEEVGVSLPKAPKPEAGLKPEDALFRFPNAPVVVGGLVAVNLGTEGGGLSPGDGDFGSFEGSGEEEGESGWIDGEGCGVLSFPKKELVGVPKPANAEATGFEAGVLGVLVPPPNALAGDGDGDAPNALAGDGDAPPPNTLPLFPLAPPNLDPVAAAPNADGPCDENALNAPADDAGVVVAPEGAVVLAPLPNVELTVAKLVGPEDAKAPNPFPLEEEGVAGAAPEAPNEDCPNTDGFCPKPVCPKPKPVCPKLV
jgi:hypothetical protein